MCIDPIRKKRWWTLLVTDRLMMFGCVAGANTKGRGVVQGRHGRFDISWRAWANRRRIPGHLHPNVATRCQLSYIFISSPRS